MPKTSSSLSRGSAPLWSAATRKALVALIALAPLLIFIGIFFLAPIGAVVIDSFRNNDGDFSLVNFSDIFKEPIRTAMVTSLSLASVSALTAAIPGGILAYLIESRGSQKLRRIVASISGVLANTGGVPLAFMFIAAMGAEGSATGLLKLAGIDIYGSGFSLYSFWGLVVVYSYFQIPMMVIVFSPAVHGLRREWAEAAMTLGASKRQFWTRVGFPLLFPSFLSATLLLFASAFSAYATARAMTNGTIPLVPTMIGNLLDGNVIFDEVNLAKALAVSMVVVTLVAMVPYLIIQRKSERWQK